jgi:hypothetical protein
VELDGGTFLLQWSAGGLLFAWVTTRRRELSLGYGWLLRATYGVLGAGGAALLLRDERFVAGGAAVAMVAVAAVALAVSVAWRRAGVRGAHARHAARRARVAAMVDGTGGAAQRDGNGEDDTGAPPAREFPPVLDLIAALAGFVGVGAAAEFAGGPALLAGVRLVVGAAFLGAVTDAMLLGHWYLVQPGLRRDPVKELVAWTAAVWPLEVAAFLWPTGMAQVLSGTVDDGYGGLLGWVWVACAAATIALVGFTWLALRERFYSAVMAATGLLYLAILTAFGTDLVARAVLSP